MQPTVKLNQSGPGGKAILEGLKGLTGTHVFVGIPEKNAPRKKQAITNAQLAFIHTHGARGFKAREAMKIAMKGGKLNYSQALSLYIHTFGSPIYNITPRPIIEPAIEDAQNRKIIEKELELAAKSALEGKESEMVNHLKRAGMLAQNLVRAWFTNPKNHWAPNAPSTIKRKGSDKPLIDKGDLRKSITYVVETK
jgi:hypothetical protein